MVFGFKKITKAIRVGTKVMINNEWCTVTKIDSVRRCLNVKEYSGSFQSGHITKFSNK